MSTTIWSGGAAAGLYLCTGLILALLVHTHYPGALGLREWISRGFHLATHFLLEKQTGEKTMKIKQAISSAILVVLLTAPTAWGQDNIRAAMEAANKEWSAAYNSMNGKAFPALYTKDAILMPPGVPPINGSEAIGQFWTDLIKAGNRKNFAIEIASIQRDGKYAYQTGRWTLDQVKDNGEVTKVGGSSVRIFEEQPDGKWLAKVHIYNLY